MKISNDSYEDYYDNYYDSDGFHYPIRYEPEEDYDSEDDGEYPENVDPFVKFPIEDNEFDFNTFSITNRAFGSPDPTTKFVTDGSISDPLKFHDWVARYNPLLYTDGVLCNYHLAFYQPIGVLIHFKSKEVKNQNTVVEINSRLPSRVRKLVRFKTGLDPSSEAGLQKVSELEKCILEGLGAVYITVKEENGRIRLPIQFDDRCEYPDWHNMTECMRSLPGRVRVMNNPNPYLPIYVGRVCKLCHYVGTSGARMDLHYSENHDGAVLSKEDSFAKGCYQYYGEERNRKLKIAVYMPQDIIKRMNSTTRLGKKIKVITSQDCENSLQGNINEKQAVMLSPCRSLRKRKINQDTSSATHLKYPIRSQTELRTWEEVEKERKLQNTEVESPFDLIDSDSEDEGDGDGPEESQKADAALIDSTITTEKFVSEVDSDKDELFGNSGDGLALISDGSGLTSNRDAQVVANAEDVESLIPLVLAKGKKRRKGGKDIEVIDLTNDSNGEQYSFGMALRRSQRTKLNRKFY